MLMLFSGLLFVCVMPRVGNAFPFILGPPTLPPPLPPVTPPRSMTFVRGDFRSSSCEAIRRSLLSCSAAAAATSDCLPRKRRCCTKRATMESIRFVSDAVISVLSTSARPSRSEPDTGAIALTLFRNREKRSEKSVDTEELLGICCWLGGGGWWGWLACSCGGPGWPPPCCC